MIDIFLYEGDTFHECGNREILPHTIDYVKSTKRFERPLTDDCLLSVYSIIIIFINFVNLFCFLIIKF